ncbi:MAG: glycoside hydrolase family 38 C-terminal domain-containing protein [Tissierellia bacterium]|nr:glycoside hydrolase family 38 C-terminal domain-containing protein [Tissierellia bacterium]
MKDKIFIIAHTHWDREWYFTDKKSIVYSLIDFDELIDYLEKNREFKTFLLDGQTSIIKDYLKFRPENTNRLKKLVKEKRIIIGPWYTQTDTLVVGGESILRNLLYGIKDSKEFGDYQKIGYLPDSFGMSAQMPMIYDNFNLKYAVFRRGIANSLIQDREFLWMSNSKKSIKAFNIYHYGIMAYPPNVIDDNYYDILLDKLKKFSNRKPYILFCGEDQKPIRKNLTKLIKSKKYDIKIESLENALDEVFKDIKLKEYQGEFTMSEFSRTHKSIFSTRADLKIKNNRLENYLVNIIEPLSVIAYKQGLKYESHIIEKAWRLFLDNQAHDSIGMCNSDKTNKVIENRYDEALDLVLNLKESIVRRIGDLIGKNDLGFQVYNTLPYEREDLIKAKILVDDKDFLIDDGEKNIEYELIRIKKDEESLKKCIKEIGVNNSNSTELLKYKNLYEAEILFKDKIPAMGFKTFNIKKGKKSKLEVFYKNDITIKKDGIYFKNNKALKRIYIENSGDEGDSYDYSKPTNDKKISDFDILSIKEESNAFQKELILHCSQKIPKNLENRSRSIFDKKQKFVLKLTFFSFCDDIKVSFKIKNKCDNHRYRIVFETDINSDKNISDTQFGTIIRNNKIEEEKNWKENGWDQRPHPIEPTMSFCAVEDQESFLQVVTDGVREYEIYDNSKIAFTIFRSIKYLGKPDLNDRPNRESGVYKIEDGHRLMNKNIEANYYINTNKNGFSNYHKFSKEKLTPMFSFQSGEILDNTNNLVISKNDYSINKNFSLLNIKTEAILSALKRKEDSQKLILRLYNPCLDKSIDYKLDYNSEIVKTKADEKTLIEDMKIKPCDIHTLVIE